MSPVEIEQAITDLAEQPFDPAEFPYAFLEAFDNKATTIKRLRAGASNKSDLGGVLQTNNIHIAVCAAGQVPQTLKALKDSPATARAKAKFILATDGEVLEAEDLGSGETVACVFKDFPDHFGFFLPLAGISTVRQISENAFDIRATSRLNRLYVELLKDNPEWGTSERRHDMNHFMARLIFCFFAEDTDIFIGKGKFTETVTQMSSKDSSNTHEVIATLFRTMNTKSEERDAANIPRWACTFALVIAEYQCDVLYRGQRLALAEFLPLRNENWITCGNALRLDWLSVCPPTGTGVKLLADDLFQTPLTQTAIDFENEGGETYLCGNPPYRGSKWQTDEQKADLANAWVKHSNPHNSHRRSRVLVIELARQTQGAEGCNSPLRPNPRPGRYGGLGDTETGGMATCLTLLYVNGWKSRLGGARKGTTQPRLVGC